MTVVVVVPVVVVVVVVVVALLWEAFVSPNKTVTRCFGLLVSPNKTVTRCFGPLCGDDASMGPQMGHLGCLDGHSGASLQTRQNVTEEEMNPNYGVGICHLDNESFAELRCAVMCGQQDPALLLEFCV